MRILVQDDLSVRRLVEGFASEEELQVFLRKHPDLFPLDEIELTPAPLICIGWEVRLAVGSEDILYIDTSGRLTVVETKLRRNPEARREVVGQILEYAANMVAWTSGQVERQAEAFFASDRCIPEYRNLTLAAVLSKVAETSPDVPSYEDFMERVEDNITNGRFRLVIAIDDTPPSLLKTVEFVNRFSDHFEMYLVQLKRFRDEERKQNIFVPALFGKVGVTKPPRPRQRWDRERFFEHARGTADSLTLAYVERVFNAFSEWTDEPLYGSGSTLGSFNLIGHLSRSRRANFAQITSNGDLYVNFGNFHLRGVLSTELIGQLYSQLVAIPGVRFSEDVSNRYPPIPKDVLRDPARLELVLAVIKSTFDAAKAEP